MYSKILIRYGELSTKGKNKMSFVRKLAKNMETLVGVKPTFIYDRMYLPYSQANIDNLQRVFGIQSYSPVQVIDTTIEAMETAILEEIKHLEGKTFKVRVSRHWKQFPGTSMDLARKLGGFILANSNLKVDVHNPDHYVEVEVREKNSFIFSRRFDGLGGYPTGINGKVLHLISGGIDSPVAAYEMMKRGIHVDYLNFITPPMTDQRTIDKVDDVINLLIKYQGKARLFRSNYTDIMLKLSETSNKAYRITLMRRSFYRIASKLAAKQHYLGLSNGENVGQVASQTLESMAVIQTQATLPIYRPILTADKLETIRKGERIGSYQLSIKEADETCETFAPAKPVIKPSTFEAERLEDEVPELFGMEDENIDKKIEMHSFEWHENIEEQE